MAESDEWRFEVEDVGDDEEEDAERQRVEPGSPSLENAVFVLLGALGLVAVFWLLLFA